MPYWFIAAFSMCGYAQDMLADTHLHLAQQLQHEGNLKEAERHFVEGKDWKAAVQMYRAADMWESALRVAKQHGGAAASKQVCCCTVFAHVHGMFQMHGIAITV